MKKICCVSVIFAALLAAVLIVLPSCASSTANAGAGAAGAGSVAYGVYQFVKPFIPAILKEAGTEATVLSLNAIPKDKSPVVAADIVTATTDCLSYLQGGNLPTADIVNQVLSAKFANLDPTVLSEISKVEATVEKYIPATPVPLTDEQKNYLIAFLQSIHDATQSWLGGNTAVTVKYTLTTNKDNALKKASLYPGWLQAKKPGASLEYPTPSATVIEILPEDAAQPVPANYTECKTSK